jgi:phage baseplate assembly protein W
MIETNNDAPSEGGQENPEDEEDVAYSWPILYYTPEGTLVVRRNFVKGIG